MLQCAGLSKKIEKLLTIVKKLANIKMILIIKAMVSLVAQISMIKDKGVLFHLMSDISAKNRRTDKNKKFLQFFSKLYFCGNQVVKYTLLLPAFPTPRRPPIPPPYPLATVPTVRVSPARGKSLRSSHPGRRCAPPESLTEPCSSIPVPGTPRRS